MNLINRRDRPLPQDRSLLVILLHWRNQVDRPNHSLQRLSQFLNSLQESFLQLPLRMNLINRRDRPLPQDRSLLVILLHWRNQVDRPNHSLQRLSQFLNSLQESFLQLPLRMNPIDRRDRLLP